MNRLRSSPRVPSTFRALLRSGTTTAGRCQHRLASFAVLAIGLIASACQSEIRFRSNFDSTPVGDEPAVNQDVGTGAAYGPPGSVLVLNVPDLPGRWLRIGRGTLNGPTAGFQGKFDKEGGEGEYTFTTTLHIPSGTAGTITIGCEPFGQPTGTLASFLDVKFLPDGSVSAYDIPSRVVGTYQRNKPFILKVRLKIGPSAGTADISLGGAGASGQVAVDLQPVVYDRALRFGGVRLWMDNQTIGNFTATNIVVTRDKD